MRRDDVSFARGSHSLLLQYPVLIGSYSVLIGSTLQFALLIRFYPLLHRIRQRREREVPHLDRRHVNRPTRTKVF